MCGTPVCMAPEIVAGCLYNYKVDVWSLGTLLFNLLTGTYPFKGKNINELKESLRKGAYKIPRDVMVSIECVDFLNCCLKFDHSKRKDIQYLFSHPFLCKSKIDSLRESKILQRCGNDSNSSKSPKPYGRGLV
jgi:serine/threonine protein kinase